MYTIKQITRLTGTTKRTLHYYDQIGLLKPSQIGDNGYRYYGEEALLVLQQILFYRELDLPLEKIKQIMGRRDFNPLDALESHKAELRKRICHLEKLLDTVDLTINHLKGTQQMTPQQLFAGFSDEEQAELEKEAMQRYDPETVKASHLKWKKASAEERQRVLAEGNALYEDLRQAMPLGAASAEVQACIERWRRQIEYFWTPSPAQLLGLAELYNTDPKFKANFDKVDPHLAEFMREAVAVYVQNLG